MKIYILCFSFNFKNNLLRLAFDSNNLWNSSAPFAFDFNLS